MSMIPVKSRWPKLSEDLEHSKSPGHCQSCGSQYDLDCWMEHDDLDHGTETLLILCRLCSDRIIEPHPRLYECLPHNQPRPGAMACCVACTLRLGLRCAHPDLKANGGEGLPIRASKPDVTFVDGRKNGKDFGYQLETYSIVPVCTGRQV